MKPLAAMSPAMAANVLAVVFDLDDTFLTHGRLELATYRALHRLHEAGIRLLAATGRPIGWGEVIARQWPLAGVVAENGAIFAVRERSRVVVRDRIAPAERHRRAQLLEALAVRVAETAPALSPSDDAHHRLTDLAWDIGEHAKVDGATVDRVVATIEAHGARSTRSSVHVHASFDTAEKADGVLAFLTDVEGIDATEALHRCVFVGDSPNDRSCFSAFSLSVGVANVRGSLEQIQIPPRFVTPSSFGSGFVEVADHLLLHRASHQL